MDDGAIPDTPEFSETEIQEKDAVNVNESENLKSKKALATPAVRRLATEHGINRN